MLCNGAVSEKNPFFTSVACCVCDSIFRMKRRSRGEMSLNGHTHRQAQLLFKGAKVIIALTHRVEQNTQNTICKR